MPRRVWVYAALGAAIVGLAFLLDLERVAAGLFLAGVAFFFVMSLVGIVCLKESASWEFWAFSLFLAGAATGPIFAMGWDDVVFPALLASAFFGAILWFFMAPFISPGVKTDRRRDGRQPDLFDDLFR